MIKTINNNVYVVMYHYVREIKKSKFSNLKGLEFRDFKKQIDYFLKNFNIISHSDFAEIIESKKIPQKKSILLTFDDGYIDHWRYVFPYLKKKKITGCFYPPVQVISKNKVLDVNKIHFILEKENNLDKILNLIFFYTKKYINKDESSLKIHKIDTKSRYDNKKTILIKRLLQNYLPLKIREKIINKLFETVLEFNEKDLSKKLYMSEVQIKEMYKNNMSFGSHGDNHFWWNKLNYENQLKEITNSINFFKKLKVYDNFFSVCYPYGGYNLNSVKILKKKNVAFALTTKVGSVNKLNVKNNFEVPRYDCNDFKS